VRWLPTDGDELLVDPHLATQEVNVPDVRTETLTLTQPGPGREDYKRTVSSGHCRCESLHAVCRERLYLEARAPGQRDADAK
jgi:hypothetical protein